MSLNTVTIGAEQTDMVNVLSPIGYTPLKRVAIHSKFTFTIHMVNV